MTASLLPTKAWAPRRLHLTALAAVLGASAMALSAGCESSSSDSDATCRNTQALTETRYKGAGLPPKTLALTFDDGPGPRTAELSHWLKAQGVPAAFFVNGKMLHGGVAVLQDLVADGHVIGNHTQTHADLTSLGASQIVTEVTETDALIAQFVPDKRFMFRPPFGAYTEQTFAALSAGPMNKYVGPIDWDLGDEMGPKKAADWDCWSPEGTSNPPVLDVKTCGDLYLAEIHAQTNGIVLLHDPYFIDDDPEKGGTVDMVKYIVPILKEEGYKFLRVDEVPAIASALPPLTSKPGTSSSSSSSSGASGTASGGSSDPCAPSPQASSRNHGESGHLRHR